LGIFEFWLSCIRGFPIFQISCVCTVVGGPHSPCVCVCVCARARTALSLCFCLSICLCLCFSASAYLSSALLACSCARSRFLSALCVRLFLSEDINLEAPAFIEDRPHLKADKKTPFTLITTLPSNPPLPSST
jgi:hypothetical protein